MRLFFKSDNAIKNLFKPIWLIAAIFLYSGSIALSNLLLIKPQLRHFRALEIQKKELDTILTSTSFQDIDKTLHQLETSINIYQDQQKQFDEKILPNNDVSTVLSELNQIVESSKLTLRYIDPLPSGGKILKKYKKAPITLKLNGSYQEFLHFLDKLENSSHWLLIDNFGIEPTKSSDTYTFNVNLFTITK